MVNSGSFDAAGSEGESIKGDFTQLEDESGPRHLVDVDVCAAEADFTAVTPEAAERDTSPGPITLLDHTHSPEANKTSLQCSVPLDKVKNVLELCRRTDPAKLLILENYLKQKKPADPPEDVAQKPAIKRLLCLFCDRTFASNNLKQKHVDRCHSAGQTRRSSSRIPHQNQSATACCFCSKLNHTHHTLSQLLHHLATEHSHRYHACLPCQERFPTPHALRLHQDTHPSVPTNTPPATVHKTDSPTLPTHGSSIINEPSTCGITSSATNPDPVGFKATAHPPEERDEARRSARLSPTDLPAPDSPNQQRRTQQPRPNLENGSKRPARKEEAASRRRNTVRRSAILAGKKLSVKSTKNGVRTGLRTTRASVKQLTTSSFGKRGAKSKVKEDVPRVPAANPTSVFSLVNAYTYKYEKIYDHSSDSIKDTNSVQFNAIFDKDFYSRTVSNIRDNLLHHLDGKLNRNVESESRISNFEQHHTSTSQEDPKPTNEQLDNFGCDLSLNAVTPVATLLSSSQYGEDFDSQIEYGAKASQKRPKKVTVVKYKFPNNKYHLMSHDKDLHSDLTGLDMWTQLTVKTRQHRCHAKDPADPEDALETSLFIVHPSGIGPKHQVEELNKILDKRGPFEDLRLEANAAHFFELRHKSNHHIPEEASKDIYFILDELLTRVVTSSSSLHEVSFSRRAISSSDKICQVTSSSSGKTDLPVQDTSVDGRKTRLGSSPVGKFEIQDLQVQETIIEPRRTRLSNSSSGKSEISDLQVLETEVEPRKTRLSDSSSSKLENGDLQVLENILEPRKTRLGNSSSGKLENEDLEVQETAVECRKTRLNNSFSEKSEVSNVPVLETATATATAIEPRKTKNSPSSVKLEISDLQAPESEMEARKSHLGEETSVEAKKSRLCGSSTHQQFEDVNSNLEVPEYLQLQKLTINPGMDPLCTSDEIGESPEEKERLELSGEWARPRIYICGTCGLKLSNLKNLEDHKNLIHPHIWCSHYEFVGSQSRIYRHLSIPGLGKVGLVEAQPAGRLWQRSDARICSKCAKQCHNLGELHKHMLECGGDWTWMLARKKCKYRPYGSRSRRRRQRGYKRSCNPELRVAREIKPKIKPTLIGPKPKPSKPSDAETIERMLANLPPKRNRKMISMRDGIQRPRKPYKQKSAAKPTGNPDKKVHFSTTTNKNAPQITKQTLRNALKRKISAQTLRKQTEQDAAAKSRSQISKKGGDSPKAESPSKKSGGNKQLSEDKTDKSEKNGRMLRNKMITRILGSKVFDSNSALVTRRRLVNAITQNSFIRKTRLRSKTLEQNFSEPQKPEDLPSRNKPQKINEDTRKILGENCGSKKVRSSPRSHVNFGEENRAKEEFCAEDNTLNPAETETLAEEAPPKPEGGQKKEDNLGPGELKSVEDREKPRSGSKRPDKRILSLLSKTGKKSKASPENAGLKTASAMKKNPVAGEKFAGDEKPPGSDSKPDTISAVIDQVVSWASGNSELSINPDAPKKPPGSKRTRNLSQKRAGKNPSAAKKAEKSMQDLAKTLEKPDKIGNKPCKSTDENSDKIASEKEAGVKRTKNPARTKTDKLLQNMKALTQKIKNPPGEKGATIKSKLLRGLSLRGSKRRKQLLPDQKLPAATDEIPAEANCDNSATVELPKNVPEVKTPETLEATVVPPQKELEIAAQGLLGGDLKPAMGGNLEQGQVGGAAATKLRSKRRTGRGLNDCIAMLKCKLEQKYQSDEPSLVDTSNLFILNSVQVHKHSTSLVENSVNGDAKREEDSLGRLLESPDKKKVLSVLEIPAYKNHSEVSTVETQTVDELSPPIDFIPPNMANIGANIQLSYVLDATLKNCLMECVKSKCEKLKFETQTALSPKFPNRKIGSVRKRQSKKKPKEPLEKHIPNVPVLAKPVPKASDSDDDIPLSNLLSSDPKPGQSRKKKKKDPKKNIAFTPLILNHQDRCAPQALQQISRQNPTNCNNLQNEILPKTGPEANLFPANPTSFTDPKKDLIVETPTQNIQVFEQAAQRLPGDLPGSEVPKRAENNLKTDPEPKFIPANFSSFSSPEKDLILEAPGLRKVAECLNAQRPEGELPGFDGPKRTEKDQRPKITPANSGSFLRPKNDFGVETSEQNCQIFEKCLNAQRLQGEFPDFQGPKRAETDMKAVTEKFVAAEKGIFTDEKAKRNIIGTQKEIYLVFEKTPISLSAESLENTAGVKGAEVTEDSTKFAAHEKDICTNAKKDVLVDIQRQNNQFSEETAPSLENSESCAKEVEEFGKFVANKRDICTNGKREVTVDIHRQNNQVLHKSEGFSSIKDAEESKFIAAKRIVDIPKQNNQIYEKTAKCSAGAKELDESNAATEKFAKRDICTNAKREIVVDIPTQNNQIYEKTATYYAEFLDFACSKVPKEVPKEVDESNAATGKFAFAKRDVFANCETEIEVSSYIHPVFENAAVDLAKLADSADANKRINDVEKPGVFLASKGDAKRDSIVDIQEQNSQIGKTSSYLPAAELPNLQSTKNPEEVDESNAMTEESDSKNTIVEAEKPVFGNAVKEPEENAFLNHLKDSRIFGTFPKNTVDISQNNPKLARENSRKQPQEDNNLHGLKTAAAAKDETSTKKKDTREYNITPEAFIPNSFSAALQKTLQKETASFNNQTLTKIIKFYTEPQSITSSLKDLTSQDSRVAENSPEDTVKNIHQVLKATNFESTTSEVVKLGLQNSEASASKITNLEISDPGTTNKRGLKTAELETSVPENFATNERVSELKTLALESSVPQNSDASDLKSADLRIPVTNKRVQGSKITAVLDSVVAKLKTSDSKVAEWDISKELANFRPANGEINPRVLEPEISYLENLRRKRRKVSRTRITEPEASKQAAKTTASEGLETKICTENSSNQKATNQDSIKITTPGEFEAKIYTDLQTALTNSKVETEDLKAANRRVRRQKTTVAKITDARISEEIPEVQKLTKSRSRRRKTAEPEVLPQTTTESEIPNVDTSNLRDSKTAEATKNTQISASSTAEAKTSDLRAAETRIVDSEASGVVEITERFANPRILKLGNEISDLDNAQPEILLLENAQPKILGKQEILPLRTAKAEIPALDIANAEITASEIAKAEIPDAEITKPEISDSKIAKPDFINQNTRSLEVTSLDIKNRLEFSDLVVKDLESPNVEGKNLEVSTSKILDLKSTGLEIPNLDNINLRSLDPRTASAGLETPNLKAPNLEFVELSTRLEVLNLKVAEPRNLQSDLNAQLEIPNSEASTLNIVNARVIEPEISDLEASNLEAANLEVTLTQIVQSKSTEISSSEVAETIIDSKITELKVADARSINQKITDVTREPEVLDLKVPASEVANERFADQKSPEQRTSELKDSEIATSNLPVADSKSANVENPKSADLNAENPEVANSDVPSLLIPLSQQIMALEDEPCENFLLNKTLTEANIEPSVPVKINFQNYPVGSSTEFVDKTNHADSGKENSAEKLYFLKGRRCRKSAKKAKSRRKIRTKIKIIPLLAEPNEPTLGTHSKDDLNPTTQNPTSEIDVDENAAEETEERAVEITSECANLQPGKSPTFSDSEDEVPLAFLINNQQQKDLDLIDSNNSTGIYTSSVLTCADLQSVEHSPAVFSEQIGLGTNSDQICADLDASSGLPGKDLQEFSHNESAEEPTNPLNLGKDPADSLDSLEDPADPLGPADSLEGPADPLGPTDSLECPTNSVEGLMNSLERSVGLLEKSKNVTTTGTDKRDKYLEKENTGHGEGTTAFGGKAGRSLSASKPESSAEGKNILEENATLVDSAKNLNSSLDSCEELPELKLKEGTLKDGTLKEGTQKELLEEEKSELSLEDIPEVGVKLKELPERKRAQSEKEIPSKVQLQHDGLSTEKGPPGEELPSEVGFPLKEELVQGKRVSLRTRISSAVKLPLKEGLSTKEEKGLVSKIRLSLKERLSPDGEMSKLPLGERLISAFALKEECVQEEGKRASLKVRLPLKEESSELPIEEPLLKVKGRLGQGKRIRRGKRVSRGKRISLALSGLLSKDEFPPQEGKRKELLPKLHISLKEKLPPEEIQLEAKELLSEQRLEEEVSIKMPLGELPKEGVMQTEALEQNTMSISKRVPPRNEATLDEEEEQLSLREEILKVGFPSRKGLTQGKEVPKRKRGSGKKLSSVVPMQEEFPWEKGVINEKIAPSSIGLAAKIRLQLKEKLSSEEEQSELPLEEELLLKVAGGKMAELPLAEGLLPSAELQLQEQTPSGENPSEETALGEKLLPEEEPQTSGHEKVLKVATETQKDLRENSEDEAEINLREYSQTGEVNFARSLNDKEERLNKLQGQIIEENVPDVEQIKDVQNSCETSEDEEQTDKAEIIRDFSTVPEAEAAKIASDQLEELQGDLFVVDSSGNRNTDSSLVIKIKKNNNVNVVKCRKPKKSRRRVIPRSLVRSSLRRREERKDEEETNVVCEICNKTFKRKENLASHRRTLTHIAKLSKIEAQENMARRQIQDEKLTEPYPENDQDETPIGPERTESNETEVDVDENLERSHENLEDEVPTGQIDPILNLEPEKSAPNLLPTLIMNRTNSNLKLVDIINEVLDKPVHDLDLVDSDYLPRNIIGPCRNSEKKRYKSLGERKSFDSDMKNDDDYKTLRPIINNGFLSKHLSLLENIIEESTPNCVREEILPLPSDNFQLSPQNGPEPERFASKFPKGNKSSLLGQNLSEKGLFASTLYLKNSLEDEKSPEPIFTQSRSRKDLFSSTHFRKIDAPDLKPSDHLDICLFAQTTSGKSLFSSGKIDPPNLKLSGHVNLTQNCSEKVLFSSAQFAKNDLKLLGHLNESFLIQNKPENSLFASEQFAKSCVKTSGHLSEPFLTPNNPEKALFPSGQFSKNDLKHHVNLTQNRPEKALFSSAQFIKSDLNTSGHLNESFLTQNRSEKVLFPTQFAKSDMKSANRFSISFSGQNSSEKCPRIITPDPKSANHVDESLFDSNESAEVKNAPLEKSPNCDDSLLSQNSSDVEENNTTQVKSSDVTGTEPFNENAPEKAGKIASVIFKNFEESLQTQKIPETDNYTSENCTKITTPFGESRLGKNPLLSQKLPQKDLFPPEETAPSDNFDAAPLLGEIPNFTSETKAKGRLEPKCVHESIHSENLPEKFGAAKTTTESPNCNDEIIEKNGSGMHFGEFPDEKSEKNTPQGIFNHFDGSLLDENTSEENVAGKELPDTQIKPSFEESPPRQNLASSIKFDEQVFGKNLSNSQIKSGFEENMAPTKCIEQVFGKNLPGNDLEVVESQLLSLEKLAKATEVPLVKTEGTKCGSKSPDQINSFEGVRSFPKPSNSSFEVEKDQRRKKSKGSTRKILNRDEELFLECCSLLKSGPEKSSNLTSSNWSEKQPDCVQRDSYSWLGRSSREDTPIGEPISNDWSNSALSVDWIHHKNPNRLELNNPITEGYQFEDISPEESMEASKTLMATDQSVNDNIPLDFHHVDFSYGFNQPQELENANNEDETRQNQKLDGDKILEEERNKEKEESKETKPDEDLKHEFDADLKKKVVSAFGGLMAKALSNRLHAVVRKSKKAKSKREYFQAPITDYTIPAKKPKPSHADSDSDCPKKLITKGAMKIFEGLKVSIPTQDLDLKEVLCVKSPKLTDPKPSTTTEEASKNRGVPVFSSGDPSTGGPGTQGTLNQTGDCQVEILSASRSQETKPKVVEVEAFGNEVEHLVVGKKGEEKGRSKNGRLKHLFSRFGNKLGMREKKKQVKSRIQIKTLKPPEDVYEFEESTTDDTFKSPLFSFKQVETSRGGTFGRTRPDEEEENVGLKWNGESESEDDRYYDSMSFEEVSVSSDSVAEAPRTGLSLRKGAELKSKENQKKCVIMGRIFKNASKPKLEDKIPEIRDFSTSEENSKMVENYLDSCSSVDNADPVLPPEDAAGANSLTIVNSANKMTKKEMDLLFDRLLEGVSAPPKEPPKDQQKEAPHPVTEEVPPAEKRRAKESRVKPGRGKKRRHSSGSVSSDEFTLGKSRRRHHGRRSKKEGGINLEQEIKECIGVAGRKSQRKCTSGKQNVLVEFWSSDESTFEGEDPPDQDEDGPTLSNPSPTPAASNPAPAPEKPKPVVSLDIYDFTSDLESSRMDKPEDLAPLATAASPQGSQTPPEGGLPKPIARKIQKGRPSKSRRPKPEEESEEEYEGKKRKKTHHKRKRLMENGAENTDCLAVTRKKRNAGEQLYYWSSSSDDEFQDMIEVKPIREDTEDDRPMQHGWIVGDSPKKLVTMLAQAKGKKIEAGESVKEQGKKNRITL